MVILHDFVARVFSDRQFSARRPARARFFPGQGHYPGLESFSLYYIFFGLLFSTQIIPKIAKNPGEPGILKI